MNHSHVASRPRLAEIARRVMLERGLLPDFSPAALVETNSLTRAARESGDSLRDLRDLMWASIDNDDSRDLDQLSVAEPAGNAVRISVAIADVDALVKKGTAIDGHARTNTTSVYTAGKVFPMLPEKLSTDLTSLGEDEDRLAIVVEFMVDADGTVSTSQVYRALVRNRAKLAYNGVAAWLDSNGPAPARVAALPGMNEQLRLQDEVAQAMKGLRHRHGALSLQSIEARAVYQDDLLTDLRPDEPNRAKDLIEDFMIGANAAVARYLGGEQFPALRRVLRAPERWDRIVALAAALGERLPAQPDAPALERFLAKRRKADPETFADLSLSVIKLLGRGEYVVDWPGQESPGHFGLAVPDYMHSTAPNRRFPDLITQRLLKAAMSRQSSPYGADELAQLALHCTAQEDQAARVERQVRKSAAALLLSSRIGERFDAIVTGASSKGTWVRISRPAVEGKLEQGTQGLDVGDRLQVRLVRTDVERGFIDFVRTHAA